MTRMSRTWWGQRFLEHVEKFTAPGRLGRGRTYANTGRILDYRIKDGLVTAKVRGSINPYYGIYKEPIYRTTVTMTPISTADWKRAIARIASRADLVTKLLMQEMPDDVEDVFDGLGLHLLPHSFQDFQTDCSCPDWENPCKHIAGLCYVLAAALDRDPFLMFELRRLARENLRAELLKSPLGEVLASSITPEDVPLQPAESFYTRPTKEASGGHVSLKEFWTGAGRVPPMPLVTPAAVPAIVIKKGGDRPAFWHKDAPFIGVMEELYERVRTKSPEMKG